MIPYYLLKSEDFNTRKITSLTSTSQAGLDTILDDSPFSSITKNKSIENLRGYNSYDLKTEILKRQKGRAYGNPDIFQNFILIKDDLLFYNKKNNLLILSTSKDNFLQFVKRFEKNNSFTYNTIPINFTSVIDNALNLGTDSVWLGDLGNSNLNSVGLMGHKVQNSNEYQDYIDSGAKVTNLSFIYDFNGQQEKIMISKEGGVILYQSKPINDALTLVVDVYNKMLLNS